MTSLFTSSDALQKLWDQLLGRETEKICKAFETLSSEEQKVVYTHLFNMANEPGWHPEQRASARFALKAIEDLLIG